MKSISYLKRTLGVLAAACTFLSAVTTNAALSLVTIDTAPLLNLPASAFAPFSLAFQFNDGGLLGSNTATVSGFNFFGGSVVGSPTLFGGATGDIASSVGFNNSSSFQELFQQFTPGSLLTFTVSTTNNVDSPAPDFFSVAILDSALNNITTDGFGNSLVSLNITGPSSTLQFSTGTGDFSGVVAAVPEPASAGIIMALGVLGLGAVRRERLRVA